MCNEHSKKLAVNAAILTIVFMPVDAIAYIGPGTGLSAIGSFLALLVGIVAVIFGFLWYPIKRMIGKKKNGEPEPEEVDTVEGDSNCKSGEE